MEITLEVLFSPRLKTWLEEDKPDGVEFTILPVRMQRDFDFTPVATIVVGFTSNVVAGLFVHWLLKKFPEKARKKITIRRRETVWDEGEILRVLEEEMKIESDSQSEDKKKRPED